MSSSQKNAGYDQEEKYFHDLNMKLIEGQRQVKGQSKALQLRPQTTIIPFPAPKSSLKKTG